MGAAPVGGEAQALVDVPVAAVGHVGGETVGVLESVASRWGSRCPTEGGPARPPAGTRNAVLNTEARTIDADVLSRRCVLMRLLDFSYEQYQKALRQSAGAVVIILPRAMAAVPQDVIRVSAPLAFHTGLGPETSAGKRSLGSERAV